MDVIIDQDCEFTPEQTSPLNSQGGGLLNYLACLGYDPVNPPLAELLSHVHQLHGSWFIVSPVHWEATHNTAMITAYGEYLGLDDVQLKSQFHLLADYFREEGVGLYFHDPVTWLISVNNKSALQAKPVHHVLNKPLMTELALIDSTMHWQKILTESQMLFASQQHQGALVLNGIWLWGGAPLENKKQIRVCADAQWLSIAQLTSANVDLYNPDCIIGAYDIVLLKDLSVLTTSHLSQLNNRHCRWYWNNIAYQNIDGNWFTRFWRALVHAH